MIAVRKPIMYIAHIPKSNLRTDIVIYFSFPIAYYLKVFYFGGIVEFFPGE